MHNVSIRVMFIDIDGTITADRDAPQIAPHHVMGNAIFDVIRDVMVEAGWQPRAATDAIVASVNRTVFWDYPDFIAEFRLPAPEVWRRITHWHDCHLIVHDDAVTMVKRLRQLGLKLYVMSNNPLTGCLLKLQRAGLGNLEGTPWFDGILGSNILRGQKYAVEFWRRALAHTGHPVESIAIVGDHDHDDHLVPAQAGFATFFIVDRRQQPAVEFRTGACYVNNLEPVARLIAEGRRTMETTAVSA